MDVIGVGIYSLILMLKRNQMLATDGMLAALKAATLRRVDRGQTLAPGLYKSGEATGFAGSGRDVTRRHDWTAEERAAARSLSLLLEALHGDGVLPGNGTYQEHTDTKGWMMPDSETLFSNPRLKRNQILAKSKLKKEL